jgi:hypothetical protein
MHDTVNGHVICNLQCELYIKKKHIPQWNSLVHVCSACRYHTCIWNTNKLLQRFHCFHYCTYIRSISHRKPHQNLHIYSTYIYSTYIYSTYIYSTYIYSTYIYSTYIKITNDFNTILKYFSYLLSMFYTNIDANSPRMTHKKGYKHVGVLVFYCNIVHLLTYSEI